MAVERLTAAGPEVAGLMYHEVTDDPKTSGFQRPGALPYILTRASFEGHLNAIAGGVLKPELVSELDLAPTNGNGKHREMPPSLNDIPAADANNPAPINKFARLDKLKGVDFENALKRLSPADREFYLQGG